MKPENIELQIEELVLHEFTPGDRYRIGEAVEGELAKVFTEQGVPPSVAQGGEAARLGGGAFELKTNSTAKAIGIQVARAVYEGLSR
jgi:hypothetical protein